MQNLTVNNVNETKELNVTPFLLSLLFIVLVWGGVFWQGLTTAVEIWIISDIFNHCLFVLPGALYLVYLKRAELNVRDVKANYLVLVLCIGSLTLYAIGLAGDVQLFMHVATFTFLPLSLWAFLGNRLAYRILFPLTFILFCIPIGEELIPALQEVTADLSMIMLGWSGIPVYRSGLYIEIPQGQFLVAEACSGISFFIASIVIGSLYAYLNILSAKRRIIFMCISIFFPIIANAIRVFGIILTGHLTDMEHAVGADHLVYGWIFFSLVIVCLLGIGEILREKNSIARERQKEVESFNESNITSYYRSLSCIVGLMLIYFIWFNSITKQITPSASESNLAILLDTKHEAFNVGHRNAWIPEFNKPYQEFQTLKEFNDVLVDVYLVWYPKGHGELISSINRLYPEKSWTLESKSRYLLDSGQSMELSTIVNPQGKRLLSYWYVIDGKMFTNNKMAKLYEIYKILMGSYVGSGLVAISQTTNNSLVQEDKISFEQLTQDNLHMLNQYFKFK